MKTSVKIGTFVILTITALWGMPQRASAQNENITLQVFYDELANYGTWIDNPDFGYVWVPNVEPGFRPYVTNGHWVFTDYGWTWSSDYPWGWAAFHYGRWYWDEQYGNVWVPDTEWGPAWVIWRQSPGYYGWAPMGPGMDMGTSYSRNYDIPADRWCFVRDRDLVRYDVGNYFIDRYRYSNLIGISSLIFNIHFDVRFKHSYVYGPERIDFQRRYGRAINPVHIYDNNRPGQFLRGDRFTIYRPQFSRGREAYNNSRPSNFLKDRDRINHNANSNNRNSNNGGPGRANQQPAVNKPQNDRERANATNNNNPVNQNQGNPNRATTPNPDNNQRMNQQGKNRENTNNGTPDRSAQPNNNQNQREVNKVNVPNAADNSQRMNERAKSQGNPNNVNHPPKPINNTPAVNQHKNKTVAPSREHKSHPRESKENEQKK
jgi:hypothetical protein